MSNKSFKKLSEKHEQAIKNEIKLMLHAHRDCLRNRCVDTSKETFDCRDGYYGEAFGVIRALQVLGYGNFGAVNTPQVKTNLLWWFEEICQEVLREENFGGNNNCVHCLERYGKDHNSNSVQSRLKESELKKMLKAFKLES